MRFYLVILIICSTANVWAFERKDLIVSENNLILSFSDISKIANKIETSALGQIWNAPEMSGFRNNQKITNLFKNIITYGNYQSKSTNQRHHLQLEELDLIKDEVVLGFNLNNENNLQVSIAIAMSKADYQKSLDIDRQLSKLSEEELQLQYSKFQNIELVSMYDKKTHIINHWQAWLNNTLLIFPKRQQLEKAIVLLRKKEITNQCNQTKIELNCTSNFFKYLQFKVNNSLNNKIKLNAQNQLAVLTGLSEIVSLQLKLIFKTNCFKIQTVINHHGKNSGFWKLLKPNPAPKGNLLNYIPKDIYSYSVNQLDLKSFWQELPQIIYKINSQWFDIFTQSLNMLPIMFNVNPTLDFFNNLDSLIVSYSRMQGDKSQDLFAIKLIDEDKMIMTLSKLFDKGSSIRNQMLPTMNDNNIKGTIVYSMPVYENNSSTTYSITVDKSYLVVGNAELIRAMIEKSSTTNNFYQSKIFKMLSNNMPKDSIAYGYTDISKIIVSYISDFKSSEMLELSKKTNNDLYLFINKLNFKRLPDTNFFNSFFENSFTNTTFKNDKLFINTSFNYKISK